MWIGITTPYLVVVSFIIGSLWLGAVAIQKLQYMVNKRLMKWRNVLTHDLIIWLVIFTWIAIPVIGLFIFKVTIQGDESILP